MFRGRGRAVVVWFSLHSLGAVLEVCRLNVWMRSLQRSNDLLLEIFKPVHGLDHRFAIGSLSLRGSDDVVADARYWRLGWALPTFPYRPQLCKWRAAIPIGSNKPDFD